MEYNLNPFNQVKMYLNNRIRQIIELIPSNFKNEIQEIRLRINRPLSISSYLDEFFITHTGAITKSQSMFVNVTKEDVEQTFKSICEYSIHSYQKELAQGFITINGGHRVGISGTAIYNGDSLDAIKYISGLNIRIAKEKIGCAEEIYLKLFKDATPSVLIIGPPSSGKTTILRDLCRLIGQDIKLSVIDERGEIAAAYKGIPQNNIGNCTDVFDGYSKDEGILMALRVMTPKIIMCDEIGSEKDSKAIINCLNSGVNIIATAHSSSVEEVCFKKNIDVLFKLNAFKYIVELGSGKYIGKITRIIKVSDLYDIKANRFNTDNNYNICNRNFIFNET